jgi:hypothetical protein
MTPKDQFRYSVLSAIHDEALSISDGIDQAYGAHVAGKDTEIERLRARSAKFEQLLSEALGKAGWTRASLHHLGYRRRSLRSRSEHKSRQISLKWIFGPTENRAAKEFVDH